jgi:hypothetical protein
VNFNCVDIECLFQKRGGKGKISGKLKENDAVSSVITTMSHDHLICIASDGTCHTIRAFAVPERPRTARGVPIGELLAKLKPGIKVAAVVPMSKSDDTQHHLLLVTSKGKVKRLNFDKLQYEPLARSSPSPPLTVPTSLTEVRILAPDVPVCLNGGHCARNGPQYMGFVVLASL